MRRTIRTLAVAGTFAMVIGVPTAAHATTVLDAHYDGTDNNILLENNAAVAQGFQAVNTGVLADVVVHLAGGWQFDQTLGHARGYTLTAEFWSADPNGFPTTKLATIAHTPATYAEPGPVHLDFGDVPITGGQWYSVVLRAFEPGASYLWYGSFYGTMCGPNRCTTGPGLDGTDYTYLGIPGSGGFTPLPQPWDMNHAIFVQTGPDVPATKDDCKKDGWRKYTEPSFKNAGECLAYLNGRNGGKG